MFIGSTVYVNNSIFYFYPLAWSGNHALYPCFACMWPHVGRRLKDHNVTRFWLAKFDKVTRISGKRIWNTISQFRNKKVVTHEKRGNHGTRWNLIGFHNESTD